MSAFSSELPETISLGKGATMTFLRNESYLTLNQFSGEADADTLYVPPHWHETHDEIFRVVKGRMEVRLDSNVRIYMPEDGDVVIRKGVVHSLRTFKGEECAFYERTDPMDEEKEIFFRNLVGKRWPPRLLEASVASYWGDTYPAFPGHFMWLEKLFVIVIGGYLAPLLGYQRDYTTLKKAE